MKALKRIIPVLFLLAGLSTAVQAQLNNTIYFMHGLTQTNRINPAHQPQCTWYFGTNYRVELSSSSLAYGDVIYPHPDPLNDSLITFLHPDGDKDAFLDQLKPVNFVATDLGISLAHAGFRTNVGFFTLDLSTRWDGNIYYPGDLARLVINGAEDNNTYLLDGIGTDLSQFTEISLGWTKTITDKLDIGIRAKGLFGMANLSTLSSDLSVYTSEEVWIIQSDMKFNASIPMATVTYIDGEVIPEIELNDDFENLKTSDVLGYMFNSQNFGLGLDVGLNYRPIEKLQVSLSLIDLGYIKWKDETHEVNYRTTYDYVGFEVNPLDFSEDYTFNDYLDSTLTQMGDSLAGFLEFKEVGPYSRRLNTKLYVGASYHLLPYLSFGILTRTDFLNRKVAEQVTASVNYTTGRLFNFSLSYSYVNAYYKNFGFGMSLNFGPINMYLVSDNALNTLLWPEESRSINLWFGGSFALGYKKYMKGPEADRPLVY